MNVEKVAVAAAAEEVVEVDFSNMADSYDGHRTDNAIAMTYRTSSPKRVNYF